MGEQDGPPERELKGELAVLFRTRADIHAAFLAIVQYEGKPNVDVALCLYAPAEIDRAEVVRAVGTIFAKRFGSKASLDIIFLTEPQRTTLEKVCRAFFVAPAMPSH